MNRSERLFERAKRSIPGGVNSPVRAFKAVGGAPIFFERGEGPYLYSVDGERYVDYVGAWGPLILGHAHPEVVKAVQEQAEKGLGFGAPTELEVEMAERLCRLVPSLEQVRLVNSGTEATMSAIRLARAYTGRDRVVKFEGCYHGHVDALLVKAGSGALTFGTPTSPGIPEAVTRDTVVLPYNDLEAVRESFERLGGEIACAIVEPVAGNMGCVPPRPGFLETLREVCDRHGALLIFDEVMTGFRVALGGAQERYGVTPDLTTLGKVIGGGLPVGAFGGKREIMERLAPEGPVYQAGTLSGNPIAVAAGLKTLELIERKGFFEKLEAKAKRLVSGLEAIAEQAGVPLRGHAVGGMFGIFFTERPVETFADVMACDQDRFRRFFHAMLREGIYFAPSPFEAGFVSAAHEEGVIEETLAAAEEVFRKL